MKLIIQIPCLDEAETLPAVLGSIPQVIPGIDCIETLVIDDGSTDGTADVAESWGVTYVLRHPKNLGLARSFSDGLEFSLEQGADIIVNTDGDNQYPSETICQLITPILKGQADIVVGDRQIHQINHFSRTKKLLQWFGSWMVRTVSGTGVPDTTSGFRAYSREAALRLNVLSRFSYTLETIIQAGKMGLAIESVPVATNDPTRPSRLQRNAWHFIKSQASTIVRLYAFYEPLRTFTYIALPFLLSGSFLLARFMYFFIIGERGIGRFAQSVTIGSGLVLVGVIIFIFGIQADIAGKHRQLTQEMLYRLKKVDLSRKTADKINRTNR